MRVFPLLLISLLLSIIATGQPAGEWLQLTPVKFNTPALAGVKDVNNKTYSPEMYLSNNNINIPLLSPEENRSEEWSPTLSWSKGIMENDTVTIPTRDSILTLNYFATYLQTNQWMKGEFKIHFFERAEVYINGKKEFTFNQAKPAERSVKYELTPGKHTLIVKTVSKGGKQFAVRIKPELPKNIDTNSFSFTTSPLHGQNIYNLTGGTSIFNAALSHDGKYIIINKNEAEAGKNNTTSDIFKTDTREVVYSFYDNNIRPRWVSGQNKVVFFERGNTGNSLVIYNVESNKREYILKEDADIKNFSLSPDMSYLIYSKSENFSDPNWKLWKLHNMEDRQGYFRSRSYLYKYDFATGLHTRLTWGNKSTSLQEISHDGNKIIFSTSSQDYSEFPFRNSSVYLMDIRTFTVDTLWKDRIFDISCRFSPDDKKLLITGGPSAFGKTGEKIKKGQIPNQYDVQLYIYDLATGKVKAASRDFNPSIKEAVWHTNNKIYIRGEDRDYIRLFEYDPATSVYKTIECPGEMITYMQLASNSNLLVYSTIGAQSPQSICLLDLDTYQATEWEQPDRSNYKNVVFGELKDWNFKYKNYTIDGRYYLPADFDPDKKYPLIVYYYGGTSPTGRSIGGHYPPNVYAANGFVVYILQPSGTTGWGQEFSARHQNNWGKITGDEIIAATKAFVKAHPFVNGSKIGCIGASYGGFTTMYLTTRTDLFACAISHAGISSISSYWGHGYWGYGYSTNATAHSYPWNRKDIYVDQSPLFNADKVNTPILLLHGTKDTNVPFSESFQFYTALKLLNKEADLVMIKDTDHHVLNYDQRLIWHNSILAWFYKYLKDQPEWWNNIYKDKNL